MILQCFLNILFLIILILHILFIVKIKYEEENMIIKKSKI